MLRILLSIAILAATSVFGQEPSLVDVDGRKVRIRVEGAGSPTVVFESGLGDSLDSWSRLIPDVAKFTRTFAYDRAGMGKSGPAAPERTYTAIVSELHAVLQHEKIAPPYILVGHSYGGALARAFYGRYPADVSGIVFVDPMTEDVFSMQKDHSALDAEDARINSGPPGLRAEYAFLKQERIGDFPILRALPKPNVPMTLLVARIDRPEAWTRAVLKRYESRIADRDDSSMFVTANSSHYIQRDEPELVLTAIRRMLYPNPLGVLTRTLHDKGFDAAAALFHEQQLRYPKGEITPRLLNSLGYAQLRDRHVDEAIRVFALNVVVYPDDVNAYDSLAEAYAVKGDRAAALANYRKSLQMDPKNSNAAKEIERLEKDQ